MRRVVLMGSLWLVACGGGPNLQQFVGSWQYSAGAALSYHCTSSPPELFDLQGGALAIFEDGGALVATRALSMQQPCTETLDVKDNVATAQAVPPCPFDAGFLPTPIQLSLTTDAFTISADQKNLFEQGVGSAMVIGIPCPAAISGTLVKQ